MFYKFKKEKQRRLVSDAIKKAGSEKKLSKLICIPKGSISAIKHEKRNLSDTYASKLCKFLNIPLSKMGYSSTLPSNWGQIKGGNELISKKIKMRTFGLTIERLRTATSKRMKLWHKHMRENEPKKYYVWQYERFKKISKSYLLLENGIKVRNLLEKEVGDYLFGYMPDFEYEPYMNLENKAYFPDFRYKNIIIEATEWKHPSAEKINNLNNKISAYRKGGYAVCFYIPEKYRKFYKSLTSPLITNLPDLKLFIEASVA